jgi:hypothetical protein
MVLNRHPEQWPNCGKTVSGPDDLDLTPAMIATILPQTTRFALN